MSPDVEWHIGEESERETVVKTQSKPLSRGRKILIGAMLLLGVSLGVAYSSVPAAPPPRTPAPAVTPLPPPPLEPVIAREAHALAVGDEATFMAQQDQVDGNWYRAQQAKFKPWGTPPGDRLYTILEQGYSATGRAWAEVNQWISADGYIRETRFYQLRDTVNGPEWKRARADRSFWSGAQARSTTAHFQLAYPAEDSRQVGLVTDRFERVYDVLCRDLNCPTRDSASQAINLIFDPAQAAPRIDAGDGLTITLPSPRLLEFHEPYINADDVVSTLAFRALLDPVTRLASGDAERWRTNSNGELILQGIQAWEQLRIQLALTLPPGQLTYSDVPGRLWRGPSQGDPAEARQFYRDLLSNAQLIALPELWQQPNAANLPNDQLDVLDAEIDALIAYIEERYGNAGVIDFLNGLGPARSLAQAIETALSVPFADFQQQWLEWIDQ